MLEECWYYSSVCANTMPAETSGKMGSIKLSFQLLCRWQLLGGNSYSAVQESRTVYI